MATDWEIKSRGHRCSTTDRQFADGETFYTLLYREEEGFARQDLSVEAWKERDKERTPFSSWKSKYEVPPPPPPEALGKQTAETLLRHYMNIPGGGGGGGDPHANVRYILALMLERKRLLKPIDTKEEPDGRRLLIYEHRQSGEVFVIPDPRLHLDRIGAVQDEVSALLSAPAFAEELAAPVESEVPSEVSGSSVAPETPETPETSETPLEESAPETAAPESEK